MKQFINAITFGLFFHEDVDVVITAEDATSGIASIQHFRSESILTEEAVKALTGWTSYTSISETAEDEEKFVYYVKLTDHAGNITYFGSDGVIFDTAAPEASGVTDGETCYTTHIVTVEDENPRVCNSEWRSCDQPDYSGWQQRGRLHDCGNGQGRK